MDEGVVVEDVVVGHGEVSVIVPVFVGPGTLVVAYTGNDVSNSELA